VPTVGTGRSMKHASDQSGSAEGSEFPFLHDTNHMLLVAVVPNVLLEPVSLL